jgi:hypothetical protein
MKRVCFTGRRIEVSEFLQPLVDFAPECYYPSYAISWGYFVGRAVNVYFSSIAFVTALSPPPPPLIRCANVLGNTLRTRLAMILYHALF